MPAIAAMREAQRDLTVRDIRPRVVAGAVPSGSNKEVVIMGGLLVANLREDVAAKMTPDQIAEAQRLASEWKPK